MKSNNNNSIDNMLKNYYSRGVDVKFDVKETPQPNKIRRLKPIYKYAAAVACVVAAIAVVIYNVGIKDVIVSGKTDIQPTVSQNTEHRFSISAYAAEVDPETKESILNEITKTAKLTRGGVYFIDNYVNFNDNDLYMSSSHGSIDDYQSSYTKIYQDIVSYHVGLNIRGDDVESFDVSCSRGNFNYSEENYEFDKAINFDVTPVLLDGGVIRDNPHPGSYEYGNNASGISYSDKKSLFWFPDIDGLRKEIDNYAKNTVGITENDIYATCTKADFDKYYGAQDEFFTKHKINEFIDDVINITLHYKDGSYQKVRVGITLDDDGNFVLESK